MPNGIKPISLIITKHETILDFFFRITINLQNGSENEPQNIPLQFDIRFNDELAIRNTLHHGIGLGDMESYGGFPFAREVPLDVSILLQSNRFIVNSLFSKNLRTKWFLSKI